MLALNIKYLLCVPMSCEMSAVIIVNCQAAEKHPDHNHHTQNSGGNLGVEIVTPRQRGLYITAEFYMWNKKPQATCRAKTLKL